jgi:hypothetical protein
MASGAGRLLRIAVGLALIIWALWGLTGIPALVVAIIGAIPLGAGLFDICLFSRIFGGPLHGPEIRALRRS